MNLEPCIQLGDTVRITRGAHADRTGMVTWISPTDTLNVRFQKPTLAMDPDGPTEVVVLPFSRRELSLVRDKHRADTADGVTYGTRTEPLDADFRPKHCAGALANPSPCLHQHPGDQVCGCGQAIIPFEDEAIVLQLRPHNSTGQKMPFIRHSRESCHEVSNASVAAGAVSA